MPTLTSLAVNQAELAQSTLQPLTAWMPPAVMAILMLAFAMAWWRAARSAEASRDHRMETMASEVHKMGDTVSQLTSSLQQLVSREQHNELARSMRADLKLTDLEVRELKTRIGMLEKE